MYNVLRILGVLGFSVLAGCTIHPQGEANERQAASEAGKPFTRPVEHRELPSLGPQAGPDELVRYALLSSPDLEQKYWDWRSAIEQIPQDGTQATNLALSANIGIMRGSTGLDRSTLSAGNDPMVDIVLPPKLSTAARRALETARAAGLRFRKGQLDLRNKVLGAYYDYALTAELIRLEQSDVELLKTTAMVSDARNRAGAAGLQDVLKARNEVDLSANDIANMQAQLIAQQAALNALLGRPAAAALAAPMQLPQGANMELSDEAILAAAARENPELIAQTHDIAARQQSIALAKLQYLPDISISAGTDLKGIAQSILGSVTVPWLRHEAIDAAVAQAQANLRSAESTRRQMGNDLNAQIIFDLTTLRDASRQLELFDRTILPRARQVVAVGRTAYETGHATLLDLLDGQRSLISIERLVANLRATRAKRLADVEAITGKVVLPATQSATE